METDARHPDTWGTFASLWDETVRAHGGSEFLRFKEGGQSTSWSYLDFDNLVNRAVATLASYGVSPGDAIHVCLKNSPGFIAIWLAAARLGCWFVPADPRSSSRDIANQIRRTSPVLGVCGAARVDAYRRGAEGVSLPVIALPESADDLNTEASPLVAVSASASVSPPSPQARLAVMFTSGTTSEPKGVELTQANYACAGKVMASAAQLRPHHRWFVSLPLFHANAQYYSFASAIAVGASVALAAEFSASRWISQARELEATHASLFASPMRMILARTPEDQPSAQLQHVWFAQNLASGHYQEFTNLVGCRPRQLYGMTETIAIVTQDTNTEPSPDTIGSVLPGRTASLIDVDTHQRVPKGQPGMIAVAGQRGEDLFAGYLDDPETTSRSFFTDKSGEEWFLTGDLGVEHVAGTWSFVGRVDDVIKVAGENVSLTEIEAAVAEAPGVLEAAVVAVEDEIRDVMPVAYIVPRDSANVPTVEDLRRWAEEYLAPSSRPREWHFTRELPRTSVGKIRRFKLGQDH